MQASRLRNSLSELNFISYIGDLACLKLVIVLASESQDDCPEEFDVMLLAACIRSDTGMRS